MIRTGCDTDEVDVSDEACCAGTVVFAADDDEHETVETDPVTEVSAWTNIVLAADENGDGPNETTDLGTKKVGAKGCTDNTDDEDNGAASTTDTEAGSADGRDPTKDKDEPVDADTDIEASAEGGMVSTEDENESAGAGTGTDAKAVAEGCTDSAEDEDEHGVAGTEIETGAEGCTDSTEELVGEGTDSEIDTVDTPSHCSIPAESKQTFEFVQSAKQSTFLSKR